MNLEKYYEIVYKYCLMKTKNKFIAEDITQECFEIYLNKIKVEKIEKVDHFLLKVAKNLCNKEFSKNKNTIPIENVEFKLSYDINVDDIISNSDIDTYKDEIISSLSDEEKRIWDYYYNKELNVKTISTLIKKSEWSVYKIKQSLDKKIKINIIKLFQK